MRGLFTLVNDNHVDNYLKENFAFVYYGSIANNRLKKKNHQFVVNWISPEIGKDIDPGCTRQIKVVELLIFVPGNMNLHEDLNLSVGLCTFYLIVSFCFNIFNSPFGCFYHFYFYNASLCFLCA